MTIFKQRSLVATLYGACIVTLVALGFGTAPARAQQNFNPLPPQVAFISNGKFTGTLQKFRLPHPLPIQGTIAYLTGDIEYMKISVDTHGPITSNTWLIQTSTDINEWETVSTFQTSCRQEVLSGDSYPQCTAWARTPRGLYVQKCTVTEQGNTTTSEKAVQLSSDNKLVQVLEYANDNSQGELIPVKDLLTGDDIFVTDVLKITMTSQGTTPPVPSDFNRPDICNPPTGFNPGENELGCTGTIPNICF